MEYLVPADPDPCFGMDKEWLLTNSRGDYASGTASGCATRRYHGLLAVQTNSGRAMLLSAMEDSLTLNGKTYALSCRVHPGVLWPEGWKYREGTVCRQDAVIFFYRFLGAGTAGNDVLLERRITLDEKGVHIGYTLHGTVEAELLLRPLVSCRKADHLFQASPAREQGLSALPLLPGFCFHPSPDLPPLYAHMPGASFLLEPDWYYRILYPVEKQRGYDWEEDLFMPGEFRLCLREEQEYRLTAGTQAPESIMPNRETRKVPASTPPPSIRGDALLEHLYKEGERFLTVLNGELLVPAGYPWFGPWGRDTLIALPGLTFVSGRLHEARLLLEQTAASMKNGLVPNLFRSGNGKDAFNAADASLWFILAVHRFLLSCPEEKDFVHRVCWPAMKTILHAFAGGTMPDESGKNLIFADTEGLLHTGSPSTQLTWMDAAVNGVPVTPRHGCTVELNALWYNALCFSRELALDFGEDLPGETTLIEPLAQAFLRVFTASPALRHSMGGGLHDTWHPGEAPDEAIRPNQIFAAALPYSPLSKKQKQQVLDCVFRHLLTPFGLRTLAPSCKGYAPVCRGNQAERDRAYHQGTVWPWLLGPFADALLQAEASERQAEHLLRTVTPLFTRHLGEAGLGCLSEIFDGESPHIPGGCPAQAWSTAEVLRMLVLMKEHFPRQWKDWRRTLFIERDPAPSKGANNLKLMEEHPCAF